MLLIRRLTSNIKIRYLVVVTSGFLLDYTTYVLLIQNGLSLYVANAISFGIGATIIVVLIRKFVFKINRFRLARDIPITLASNGMIFIFGTLLLWVAVQILFVNPYAAKLISSGVTFVINYMIRITIFGSR